MSEISDVDYPKEVWGGSWLDRDGSIGRMESIRAENEREDRRKEWLKTHPIPDITPEQYDRDDEISRKRFEDKRLLESTLRQILILDFSNCHEFIIYRNISKGLVDHWYEAYWYIKGERSQFVMKDKNLHDLVSSLVERNTSIPKEMSDSNTFRLRIEDRLRESIV